MVQIMEEGGYYSGDSDTEADLYEEIAVYQMEWSCEICQNLSTFDEARVIHDRFLETGSYCININGVEYVVCKNRNHCVHLQCLPEGHMTYACGKCT